MHQESWIEKRAPKALAEDWAKIRECRIQDIERSALDFRLICWIVSMLFGLALFVGLGLPFLFESVSTTVALFCALIFTSVGLLLLSRAPTIHLDFVRDAAELERCLYSINPLLYRRTSIWTDKSLSQLAHSIYINQIGRNRCAGSENDLAQLDAIIKEKCEKFDRLHAAASRFWEIKTKDLYRQHAPTRRHLGEE